MSSSRGESQHPSLGGRKRSNTVQSVLKSSTLHPPLREGDSKLLTLWVEDPSNVSAPSPDVQFNIDWWPGVAEGDMIEVKAADGERSKENPGFLFIVGRSEGSRQPNLQISVSKSVAHAFGLRTRTEVILTKVDQSKKCADYIEIVFQDQYLSRCDMWRLGKELQKQCVYVNQEISFLGMVTGRVKAMYIDGRSVPAGYITTLTKAIYRSLSAKVNIFIQVCRELWEFSADGERYSEKIIHSFLPALFRRWREENTNHIVTIVLISRVFYDESEVEYAAGPLRQDDEGNWYKDFFKVITDLEVISDWQETLYDLKDSFWAFQRDILLTHHYHQQMLKGAKDAHEHVRLVGEISCAHDGPILEALNLSLNPTETHYIDRSLSLTGVATILITPGTGYYRISKRLLRLTTTRVLDQGFGLDIVCMAKPPLHKSPIFSFRGTEPKLRDKDVRVTSRHLDPLWGGDHFSTDAPDKDKATHWWEPFWVSSSFWDKQMDLPFREDRFIARAKMHQIQMLGLLEHDVLAGIQVPYLLDANDPMATPMEGSTVDFFQTSKADADRYDNDRFTLGAKPSALSISRDSGPISSGGGTTVGPSSLRSDKRASFIAHAHAHQRNSVASLRFPPIEESPRRIFVDLPDPAGPDYLKSALSASVLSSSPGKASVLNSVSTSSTLISSSPGKGSMSATAASSMYLSSSPGRASILSNRSNKSNRSDTDEKGSLSEKESIKAPSISRGLLPSRFSSPWFLFSPFKSGATAQTSNTSVSVVPTTSTTPPSNNTTPRASTSGSGRMGSSQPRPMTIKGQPNRPDKPLDSAATITRNSMTRVSPLSGSPRDEPTLTQRRATLSSASSNPMSSTFIARTNPLGTASSLNPTQTSLASRWQHMFPQPMYRHQIKWNSMVTPGCLPLTTEHFPTRSELESSYDVFSYEFVLEPSEMRSVFVKNPGPPSKLETKEQAKQNGALVVMRGMAALRLAQGFQFVVGPGKYSSAEDKGTKGSKYFADDEMSPKPTGASEIFQTIEDPVYLSMSNEIHRISWTGEMIQVRRYVRRMPPSAPVQYECLVWPKLGVGYTELKASFTSHGLENYHWNRVDMLVAGYEQNLTDSLRYWRTRFVVIPSTDPPQQMQGPAGEKLSEEEVRLLGIDKLAELFTKVRWTPSGEKNAIYPPVRFLPTTLGPAESVADEYLVSQLEELQSLIPWGKKLQATRDIREMKLQTIAKLMREDNSLAIKDHKWHKAVHADSFSGYDFVSWLVREFRDISTREQGTEFASKLMEQGLFEHCRAKHGFIDGHYFYRLKGEYAVLRTPRSNHWFRSSSSRYTLPEEREHRSQASSVSPTTTRRPKKRIVLSQTVTADVDMHKRSDQAEFVILHYDLMHNPANVFHFELNWIGTTARCIEDVLRFWTRSIEKYGLKLVEAYVSEISDIRDRNPFQSCFPIALALEPHILKDIEKRIPEGSNIPPKHYFEYSLLRKHNFILDIEAGDMYPSDRVEVFYSYRRSTFTHSQFVHRTGAAFVQVLDDGKGFLFLTNRLMGVSQRSRGISVKPADAAERIRLQLCDFCADREKLRKFYEEKASQLQPLPEEPEELSI